MCINLEVDTIHPEHEVSHHVEEAEFLHCVQQEESASLTSLKQALPGRGHCMFTPVNVISFFSSIRFLQPCCIILNLVHLGDQRRVDIHYFIHMALVESHLRSLYQWIADLSTEGLDVMFKSVVLSV